VGVVFSLQVLVVGSLLTSCVEDADVTAYLTEDQLSNVAQDDPDKTFSVLCLSKSYKKLICTGTQRRTASFTTSGTTEFSFMLSLLPRSVCESAPKIRQKLSLHLTRVPSAVKKPIPTGSELNTVSNCLCSISLSLNNLEINILSPHYANIYTFTIII
jgi:hypothetical protein